MDHADTSNSDDYSLKYDLFIGEHIDVGNKDSSSTDSNGNYIFDETNGTITVDGPGTSDWRR